MLCVGCFFLSLFSFSFFVKQIRILNRLTIVIQWFHAKGTVFIDISAATDVPYLHSHWTCCVFAFIPTSTWCCIHHQNQDKDLSIDRHVLHSILYDSMLLCMSYIIYYQMGLSLCIPKPTVHNRKGNGMCFSIDVWAIYRHWYAETKTENERKRKREKVSFPQNSSAPTKQQNWVPKYFVTDTTMNYSARSIRFNCMNNTFLKHLVCALSTFFHRKVPWMESFITIFFHIGMKWNLSRKLRHVYYYCVFSHWQFWMNQMMCSLCSYWNSIKLQIKGAQQ